MNHFQNVISEAKKDGFEVVYGDTDSCFLQLNDLSKEDALDFVKRINKDLPGVMELELENYYPAGIFVSVKAGEGGAKKKYALIDSKGVLKIRGFETVRRNWSRIAKETQQKVLELLLRDKNIDAAKVFVKEIISNLKNNLVPIEKVVISTQISKDISDYDTVGPHVAAAQRLQDKGIKITPGMTINYIVTKGKGKIRDRVKLDTETKQEEYDGEYYINNQILPGVERIFAAVGVKEETLTDKEVQKGLFDF